MIGSNTWNSNGKCKELCSGYAFAVVQYQDCWCSNYAPGDATSTGDCSVPCPGYPFESCGDQSSGLFGYVALGPAPSGTRGASSPSNSPSSSPSQPQSPNPSQPVSTQLSPFTSVTMTADAASTHSPGPFGSLAFSLQPSGAVSSIDFITDVLILVSQSSPPPDPPSPTTVQDTVTATPSVSISMVSVVCFYPHALVLLLYMYIYIPTIRRAFYNSIPRALANVTIPRRHPQS